MCRGIAAGIAGIWIKNNGIYRKISLIELWDIVLLQNLHWGGTKLGYSSYLQAIVYSLNLFEPDVINCVPCLNKGQEIHGEVERVAMLQANHYVDRTLVEIYGKCGFLVKAKKFFSSFHARCAVKCEVGS
ncbi:hypothetical protein GOP47_0028072 [Adiantum capillus-veneris]|nr:hypothetical protein GOP47_0028072 [Adiantum capillus-veneris]